MHFISSAMASFCLETTVEDAMQTVPGRGVRQPRFPAERIQPPAGRAAARRRLAPVGARGCAARRTGSGCPSRRHTPPGSRPFRTTCTTNHLMKSMSGRWRPAPSSAPPADLPSGAVSAPHAGPQPLAAHPRLERPLVPRASAAGGEVRHCDQSGKHVRLSPSAAAGRRARALHNRPRHAGARLRHWLEPCAALPRHRPCPHQRAGRARR